LAPEFLCSDPVPGTDRVPDALPGSVADAVDMDDSGLAVDALLGDLM